MYYIEFRAEGQALKRVDNQIVASDSKGFLYAKFDIDAGWDGLALKAVFEQNGNKYVQVLDDDICLVPVEVLNTGRFKVWLVGVDYDDVVRATTESVTVEVKRGPGYDAENSTDPTPEEKDQILSVANEAKRIASSVREDADEGKFDGGKGEPGDSGVYVGSGEMPENCNVQIDPDGDAFDITELESVAIGKTQPNGKNVKLWACTDDSETENGSFEKVALKYKADDESYKNVFDYGKWLKQYRYEYREDEIGHENYQKKILVDTLPYWIRIPYNPYNVKMPLIVVLHSAHFKLNPSQKSESMDDMVNSVIFDDFTTYLYQGKYGEIPAYVVMPQIEARANGTLWSERGEEVKNLIRCCKQKFNVSKVYLVGYSLGGRGAWELGAKYESLFDRVLTVAGNLENNTEERIGAVTNAYVSGNTKVWCIVGEKDSEVNPGPATSICEGIAEMKPENVKLTTITNGSHSTAIKYCLTNRLDVFRFLTQEEPWQY